MTPLIVDRIVCHVLLCESNDGLVLVDSGLGLADCADHSRIGPARFLVRARFDESETAARQIEALGHARSDVRHIVVTHFDMDHVGGLSDFPDATVHTTADEFGAANDPPTREERRRYRSVQWSHRPKVQTYAGGGEPWQGFQVAYPIVGVEGLSIVPMNGHTRGHALVAVDSDDRGWLLHAGDAVFDRGSIAIAGDSANDRANRRTIKAFEWAVGQDRSKIAGNHARLTQVRATGTATVIPAHDPVIFDRMRAAQN
jgi:glyoxylase-like metal-dependent hydrolase (beta-lactamase superfamily II)